MLPDDKIRKQYDGALFAPSGSRPPAHQIEVAEIPERRVVWGQKRAATLGVLATIVGGLEEQRPSYPSRLMGLERPD